MLKRVTEMTPMDDVAVTEVAVPRSVGDLDIVSKARDGVSVLRDFRTSGALRALFPHGRERLEAILINTSGGLTGGDRITMSAHVEGGSHLTLSTQAAERAYRASNGVAQVTTSLAVEDGASLFWLPQEMILFDHCAIERRLEIDLAPTAQLLMVEPVVFGRSAMGESVQTGLFHDRIDIRRSGAPLYLDRVRLSGGIADTLSANAVMASACALASVVYVAPDAEAHLDYVRDVLPPTGGASLLHPDMLVIRVVAGDSFELRQSLVPILDRLSRDNLPKSWRL